MPPGDPVELGVAGQGRASQEPPARVDPLHEPRLHAAEALGSPLGAAHRRLEDTGGRERQERDLCAGDGDGEQRDRSRESGECTTPFRGVAGDRIAPLSPLLLTLAVLAQATAAVHVDQAGYLPGAAKRAVVVADPPASSFLVRSESDGSVAFDGELSPPRLDPDTGDTAQWADFSSLEASGRYRVEVPGAGRSWPFEIGSGVYDRALYLAMRSYYGQRCGTDVDLGEEFPGYSHPACHLRGAWHASSGRTGERESSGGWHDAGDYGRYVVNSGITTGTLLLAWELFPARVESLDLDLPPDGSLPDLLAEVRWNLDWMLTMQDDDGGAWHKQTSASFPGFVMPQEDDSVSLVVGTGAPDWKGTCATADLAAVAAIAARVYGPWDAGLARRSLEASRRAWEWLEARPADVTYANPPDVSTGAYGDGDCSDERLWAAAELWRSGGHAAAHEYFLARFASHLGALSSPPGWPRVAALGLWSYALAEGADPVAAERIREAVRAGADAISARAEAHPYGITLVTTDYVWGSNGVAGNYGVLLLMASRILDEPRYVATALSDLHYLLGRNTFSVSWVTGVGANPFRHPHHRPSGADANSEPWPGLLSGGPNRNRQDPAMQALPPGTPPGRSWLDEQASYATNENAINWNAALVFLLAGVSR